MPSLHSPKNMVTLECIIIGLLKPHFFALGFYSMQARFKFLVSFSTNIEEAKLILTVSARKCS